MKLVRNSTFCWKKHIENKFEEAISAFKNQFTILIQWIQGSMHVSTILW